MRGSTKTTLCQLLRGFPTLRGAYLYRGGEPRETRFEELELFFPEALELNVGGVKFGSGGRDNQRETAGEE